MTLYLTDSNNFMTDVITNYISLTWVTRYYGVGEFELQIAATSENIAKFTLDKKLRRSDKADTFMFIERIELTENSDGEDVLKISGRSVESILTRRIVWVHPNQPYGRVTNNIYQYVTYNAVQPVDPRRKIEGLVVDSSLKITDEEPILGHGKQLDEAVTDVCKEHNIGWKIQYNGNYVFKLYQGTNKRLTKIIDARCGELQSAARIIEKKGYRNYAYVEGDMCREAHIQQTAPADLERREVYISSSVEREELSDADYTAALYKEGQRALRNDYIIKNYIDGEADLSGNDINVGDIVMLRNNYGNTSAVRVIELADCFDEAGRTQIPTFEEVE